MCASRRDAAADIADARLQATVLAAQASSNLVAKHQKQDKKFADDIMVSERRLVLVPILGVLGSAVFVEFFLLLQGLANTTLVATQ